MRTPALVTCLALAGFVAGCVQTMPLPAEGAGGGPMPSHDGSSCRHSSFEWREPGLFEAARSLPGATLRQPSYAMGGFRQGVIDHPDFGSWYHGMVLDSADWSDGAGRRLHFAPLENGTEISGYVGPSDWADDDVARFVAVVGALIPASDAELAAWANESHPSRHDIADAGGNLRFVQASRAADPARLMEALQAGDAATAWQSLSGLGYVTLEWPEWKIRMALPTTNVAEPAQIGVDGADLVRLELYPDVVSTQAAKHAAQEAFAELGLPKPTFRQWAATDC
jgi:hypothetical protein